MYKGPMRNSSDVGINTAGGHKKRRRNIAYTADFVNDPEALLRIFPPKHTANVFAHHMTIAFKPASLEGIELGKEVSLSVVARVFDEKGDALLVEAPWSMNEHPHITLSCAKGVDPVYSNEMIARATEEKKFEYVEQGMRVDASEGYFDGKKSVISQNSEDS